jgi:tRNA-dihydrouridine synthase A
MKEPDHVAECLRAMREASGLPCTVKCRLGIDDLDSYEFFRDFIDRVSTKGGVKHFIVHARKALLKGLNPAQNRSIPPLRYQYVYDIKRDFPDLRFTINGGFKTYEAIE